jgi:hypothetical protein
MIYKINTPITIRYVEVDKTSGIEIYLVVKPPTGNELDPILMTDLGNGLYEATFTPDAIGWWWVRIYCPSKPKNLDSKSYFVGYDYFENPTKETTLSEISEKIGEVDENPTQHTLLDRIKSIYNKIVSLFENGLAKINIWDGNKVATVNKKDTSASGLNTLPLGKSTGTYYPNIDEEDFLESGDVHPIKINADGLIETRSAVLTDEGSLYDTFKGNDLSPNWIKVIGEGASYQVSNSRVTINAGTINGSESYIAVPIDYCPLKIVGKIKISQRIANQDIYFELADGENPSQDTMFARFHFVGTDNTKIRCETQSSLDVNGNEGLLEDFMISRTDNFLVYTITISEGKVSFYVQEYSTQSPSGLIIERFNEIPDFYGFLYLRIRVKNNGEISSNTQIISDWVKIFNFNNLSISNVSNEIIQIQDSSLYQSKSVSAVVDITIPANTDYWILDINNKKGFVNEIHITTNDANLYYKIEVDGELYFNESGNNLLNQYNLYSDLDVPKKISTNSTGTQFHCTQEIAFNKSIKIGIRTVNNNKKLTSYLICYGVLK